MQDIEKLDTNKVYQQLLKTLEQADKQYFAPLSDREATGDVDTQLVADIHLLSAELTARYLLSGF